MNHIKPDLWTSVISLAILTAILPAVAHATERRPNVILLMADDISARDFPIYGSSKCAEEWAQTPMIDKLATEGCYLNTVWASTVCMPTRAMVMSGRYAHLTKWWDNGQIGKRAKGGAYGVPESSPLGIGQVVKQAGYQSIWAGKTHVTSGSHYTEFGFDQGVFSPGEPEVRGDSPYEHFKNVKRPSFWNYHSFLWWPEVQLADHPGHPDKTLSWVKTGISDYGPDIELEQIFEFIDRSRKQEKPFFVYHTSHLGHQAVDMADPKFPMTWPGTPKITWNPDTQTYGRHTPKITPNGPVNTLRTTYEMENITPNTLKSHIEYLDYQLWLYVTRLKELGELKNTILIFTADNGTKGWKASVVKQRGMHVPFVVYAPGQPRFVKGPQDIISDLSDLLPTLAEIMGTPLPPQDEYELSGQSLWPFLTKQKDQHRDWIYGFKGKAQMVRGHHLLRDGNGDWWDVSKPPADLDHFPPVEDFSTLSDEQKKEKSMIDQVLAQFAREDVGGPHSFHADPSRKLTAQEIEKMRARAEHLKNHLKQFE